MLGICENKIEKIKKQEADVPTVIYFLSFSLFFSLLLLLIIGHYFIQIITMRLIMFALVQLALRAYIVK